MCTVVAGGVCRDDIRHSGVDVDIVYYIYWGCNFSFDFPDISYIRFCSRLHG